MSVVYYVPTENDELLIATMADRAKAKVVGRNGKVSLCILDETGRSPTCRSIAMPGSTTIARPSSM